MALITLLTDFGAQDNYVGVIKAVILVIAPDVTLLDLCHGIPPQDRWAARFQLLTALPYCPREAVHLAVVDPGVGSDRRGIAVRCDLGWLVGPDNGLFTGILDRYPAQSAWSLDNPQLWRTPQPSPSFHGRDIFAPVAAHLAAGVEPERLGTPLDPATLVRLDLPPLEPTAAGWQGSIQAIDHFGNLISDLPLDLGGARLDYQGEMIPCRPCYAEARPGELLALPGSHGFWEVAVNQGHAAFRLRARVGDRLDLCG